MKIQDLFAVEGRVDRRTYAGWGFSLMLLKYGVDAAIIYFATGTVWTPLHYLSPLLSTRMALSTPILACLAMWTLPFIWVGLALSARRCRDAGVSVLAVGYFFLPVINYIFMLIMCVLEPHPAVDAPEDESPPADESLQAFKAALMAALLAVPLVGVLTHFAPNYTSSMFVGVPFLMGAVAGRNVSSRGQVTVPQLLKLCVVVAAIVGGLLLLFALEGAICLLMTVPLALPVLLLGALLGRELRKRTRARARQLLPAFVLPLALLHAAPRDTDADADLHAASSSITIQASPEQVFAHVVSFSELPPPDEWLFRLTGIAYPLRADIVGSGVGAVRHCQFTTGAFVEPITAWVPGKHLAFNVTQHPPSMEELSPYHALQPAHLENTFQSRRGEFRMHACGDGATCLTGTTWYTLQMGPSAYWQLWADAIVKTIHGRVLRHVKALAEGGP